MALMTPRKIWIAAIIIGSSYSAALYGVQAILPSLTEAYPKGLIP